MRYYDSGGIAVEILGGVVIERRIGQRKVFQYLGLFSVLVLIYAMALSRYIKFLMTDPAINSLGDLMRPLVAGCILSAVPFALLAYSDENWRSRDAAPACAAAWAIVAAAFLHKYHTDCAPLVAAPFLPFIASAILAHGAGHATRFLVGKAISD